MNLDEFLEKTYRCQELGEFSYDLARIRLVCNDGFSMSVQGGRFHSCQPIVEGYYKSGFKYLEVGYPSEYEALLCSEDEYNTDGFDDIYPHVSVETINRIIEKHGGIDEQLINKNIMLMELCE